MKRARPAGYTLIEVMVGVLISAIGIAGVTFMQTASVRGNQDAFETTVATNFARTWLERVKRDALLWNTAGNPNVGTMFADRAAVPGDQYFVPSGRWTPPRAMTHVANAAQESSGADFHGYEVGSPLDPLAPNGAKVTARDIHYCVHLRFNPVQVDTAGLTVALGVDARVYWVRRGSLEATSATSMMAMRGGQGCDSAAATFNDVQMAAATTCQLAGAPNYCLRVHYLRTIVRMVPP